MTPKRHHNLAVTEDALALLRANPYFAQNALLEEVSHLRIPSIVWSPLTMASRSGEMMRAVRGPHYGISHQLAGMFLSGSGARLFVVHGGLVGIQLASYIDFDEAEPCEMDYVDGEILIYELCVLEAVRRRQADRGV